MSEQRLNEDFVDLLRDLVENEVAFLIVGAHAMAFHGVSRSTGDIDILVRPTPANAERVIAALHAFGAPLGVHGIDATDFANEGWVYQMGLPPRRIDLLTSISGVPFETAWKNRGTLRLNELQVPVLGLAELRANKAATGRPKDRADLALLDELFGDAD